MDVVALCEALIRIDSRNPFTTHITEEGEVVIEGREQAILSYCEDLLSAAGWRIWRQDCGGGRENLIAEKGQGKQVLMAYAHVDTVEVKAGWTHEEAFTPRRARRDVDGRQEDVLIGLGSNDMKGGLAVLLRVAQQYQPQHLRLRLVLGCDEEFWSLGSHRLCQDDALWEDVIGVIVPEVGESTTAPQAGSVLATLGRCGRCELLVDIPGSGGHGAEPHAQGRINALSQAAHLALAIEASSAQSPPLKPFPGSDQLIRSSALVTQISGGDGTLSIPDHARLVVNRVLIPNESPQMAKAQLEALIEDLYQRGILKLIPHDKEPLRCQVSLRERPTPPLLPYLFSPDEPFLKRALDTLKAHAPVTLGMGVSVADENRFAAERKKPVLVLGPRGEDSHAPHEWVSIPSLFQLERLYLALFSSFDFPI